MWRLRVKLCQENICFRGDTFQYFLKPLWIVKADTNMTGLTDRLRDSLWKFVSEWGERYPNGLKCPQKAPFRRLRRPKLTSHKQGSSQQPMKMYVMKWHWPCSHAQLRRLSRETNMVIVASCTAICPASITHLQPRPPQAAAQLRQCLKSGRLTPGGPIIKTFIFAKRAALQSSLCPRLRLILYLCRGIHFMATGLEMEAWSREIRKHLHDVCV